MCELETINYFVKRYYCGLEIMDTGEHYFHTEEQLNVFQNWLRKYTDIEKCDERNWGGDSFEYTLKLCLDTLINII